MTTDTKWCQLIIWPIGPGEQNREGAGEFKTKFLQFVRGL